MNGYLVDFHPVIKYLSFLELQALKAQVRKLPLMDFWKFVSHKTCLKDRDNRNKFNKARGRLALTVRILVFDKLFFIFYFIAVTTQGSVDPVEASSLLAHHITYLCRRQDAKTKVTSTKNEEIHFGDTSDFCSIRHINNVLNAAITNGQHDVTIAMLVALQTLMIQVSERANKLDDNSVKGTKHLVWKLVQSPADSVGAEIKLEAFKVLTVGLEVFYSTPSERSALLMLLLSEGESSSDMAMLLNFLLSNLTENLMSHKPGASSNER